MPKKRLPYHRYSKYCDSLYESDSVIHSEDIMKEREYTDEIYTIHHMIEANINKVDVRISELGIKLSSITSTIDDIVGSIAFTQRNSSSSECSVDNMSEDSRLRIDHDDVKSEIRPSYNIDNHIDYTSDEPIVDHINNIFKEFHGLNEETKRYSIHTPPFTPEIQNIYSSNELQL